MIGLNTSAFIEAAIVGRPVHTIVVPRFAERREGTVHFHYLKSVGGGVFRLAQNFDEHRRSSLPRCASRFLRTCTPSSSAFVRPFGLDRAATDVFGAILDLGRSPTAAPGRAPLWAPALQLLLRPLALAAHVAVARIGIPDDRTVLELQRGAHRRRYRRQRDARRQRNRGP